MNLGHLSLASNASSLPLAVVSIFSYLDVLGFVVL